ncbi:MAG: rhodanese-like domain-containing protein [Pyrinomonadaceae bacterium]
MSFIKLGARVSLILLICAATTSVRTGGITALGKSHTDQQIKAVAVELISAEELKAKVDKNELVTIIDVRASSAYADSDNQIKGAIHIKLRRLKYRLAFPPLKNVPKDREMVTYCACPSDESSIRAAQVLMEAGFKRVRVLKGGWQAWLDAKGKVESRTKA